MRLESGMRVRCVDASFTGYRLVKGEIYLIYSMPTPTAVALENVEFNWAADRFKPVVRVKAKCVPSTSLLLKRAIEAYAAMTPKQKQHVHGVHHLSWVRGQIGWD